MTKNELVATAVRVAGLITITIVVCVSWDHCEARRHREHMEEQRCLDLRK